MRIPNAEHESHHWRIQDIAPDFILEDVWAIPAYGGAEDFPQLIDLAASSKPGEMDSRAARSLWALRDLVGKWFGIGRISTPANEVSEGALTIPGTHETSLADRLPDDLRGTAADLDFGALPFAPLYRSEDEFAAEISNQTVHGVMHLAWAEQGPGRYQGQMAVYVKPRGPLGKAYLGLIKPFRYWIIYPALMRRIERTWDSRDPERRAAA